MNETDERQVLGVDVFVAESHDGEHVVHLRVGDDWDSIGERWLTIDQLQDLIALLVSARKRYQRYQRMHRTPRVQTVWQDRHLPPFNVPPTYPVLRAEEV